MTFTPDGPVGGDGEALALRFLLEVSTALSSSLEFEESLRSLASLCVPVLADICLIDVLVDGEVRRMAAAPDDSALAELAHGQEDPPRRSVHANDRGDLAVRVIRTGASQLVEPVPDDTVDSLAGDQPPPDVLGAVGVRSCLAAPLSARGRVLGALTLGLTGSGRRFGDDQVRLAEELGRRAGLVIDNARLFSERARIARALQSALLPPTLPDIPGVEVAARYVAAGAGNEVGGDFYDVFALGRDGWAIAVGDVRGSGPEAAAVTGLVRHSLRASGLQTRDPVQMLRTADTLLREQPDADPEAFCTACCVVVRTKGSGVRATVATAGHPSPLVLHGDGSVEELTCWGPILGALPAGVGPGTRQRLVLGPGDLLVLFTDGLTEARDGEGRFFGETALGPVLSAQRGRGPAEVADELLAAVEAFAGGPLHDDLAIVAVAAAT